MTWCRTAPRQTQKNKKRKITTNHILPSGIRYNMKALTWTKVCHIHHKHLVHTYKLPCVSVPQHLVLGLNGQTLPAVYYS
uniref:Uncharacterized protein n=1 Tax=Anguilla anguilla TaxID=7936 RepID=A0A0E9XJJ9_ANGAN